MLLQLSKHLLSQWVGKLSIDAGIPDILMPQVIGNILNTASSFKEIHGSEKQKHRRKNFAACLQCVIA
jgi:hypothetical protein